MAWPKGKPMDDKQKKELAAKWSGDKKTAHRELMRKRNEAFNADRGGAILTSDTGKWIPHPANKGTPYEGFPAHVTNVHTHSLGTTRADQVDWEPVVDEGFVPTDHLPGSVLKIMVMEERLEKGYPLYHPDDATNIREGYDMNQFGALQTRQYADQYQAGRTGRPMAMGRLIKRVVADIKEKQSGNETRVYCDDGRGPGNEATPDECHEDAGDAEEGQVEPDEWEDTE